MVDIQERGGDPTRIQVRDLKRVRRESRRADCDQERENIIQRFCTAR